MENILFQIVKTGFYIFVLGIIALIVWKYLIIELVKLYKSFKGGEKIGNKKEKGNSRDGTRDNTRGTSEPGRTKTGEEINTRGVNSSNEGSRGSELRDMDSTPEYKSILS